ncbi:MAG: multicopper oxidase domain-containing protein [Candidatus Limnocylindrales bacterium]
MTSWPSRVRKERVAGGALTFVFLVAVALYPATPVAEAASSPQQPLSPHAIPQFIEPLPVLDAMGGTIATVDGTHSVKLRMCEFRADVLPAGVKLSSGRAYRGTWVWGYLPDRTRNPTTTCADLVDAASGGSGVVDTFIGPVVLAQRGIPTKMTWVNDLPTASTTHVLAYRYSTDQTLHWADPLHDGAGDCAMSEREPPAYGSRCAQNYSGAIPAVPHLHGGEVPAAIDGGPDAWFTSDGAHHGHAYYTLDPVRDAPNSAVYRYPNSQSAAPLWFHDHTLGATRLNVYAGLAGGYLIADPAQRLPTGLAPFGLQRGSSADATIPLVIQDRMFDSHGQLYFPADNGRGGPYSPNPDHPYWVPEFMGDTILVNGKAWPYLNVEPKRYRFLFLNGSNARTYDLRLADPVSGNSGPPVWVIAGDGGYLNRPARVGSSATAKGLVIMPGERYEAIVDFAGYGPGIVGPNGRTYSGKWILRNAANAPYPTGEPVDRATTARVMEFVVGRCRSGNCGAADTSYNPATRSRLRTPMVRLDDDPTVDRVRELTLNEVMGPAQNTVDPVTGRTVAYPGGPLEVLLNNTEYMGGETARVYGDFTRVKDGGSATYYSEFPREGQTELWEIVNLTADAHPIHLHLVQFQVLDRQKLDLDAYLSAYEAAFPGGSYIPAFGPPQDYRAARNPLGGGKYGGNPDVDALGANGRSAYLLGQSKAPRSYESGWKDTIIAPPGTVTRLLVRWAPTDLAAQTAPRAAFFAFSPDGGHGYVWHCHIIDHEDNEMMRPFSVIKNHSRLVHRTYRAGVAY